MEHVTKTKILIFLLLMIVTGSAGQLDSLSKEILDYLWAFHPVSATYQGIHQYDTLLTDCRPTALKNRFKNINNYLKRLDAMDTLTFSTDSYVDYILLRTSLQGEIFFLDKAKSYQKNPLIYTNEAINGIY